jgi:hypothetical protein
MDKQSPGWTDISQHCVDEKREALEMLRKQIDPLPPEADEYIREYDD